MNFCSVHIRTCSTNVYCKKHAALVLPKCELVIRRYIVTIIVMAGKSINEDIVQDFERSVASNEIVGIRDYDAVSGT